MAPKSIESIEAQVEKDVAAGLYSRTIAEHVEQPGFFQEQFRERGQQSRAAPIQRVIRR